MIDLVSLLAAYSLKGAERVSELMPQEFSEKIFDGITSYGHQHMPFGNNVLSLEEKLAVRDSFFKNPEFANITVNSKRAISGVILDFASTSVVQRALFKRKYGFEAPTHMVISPTERCNYQCRGCYAMDYEKKEELSEEEFQNAINQGKSVGMRFFVITGGEDYAWKRFLKEHGYPLLDIFRRNQDCLFLTYTNGS